MLSLTFYDDFVTFAFSKLNYSHEIPFVVQISKLGHDDKVGLPFFEEGQEFAILGLREMDVIEHSWCDECCMH